MRSPAARRRRVFMQESWAKERSDMERAAEAALCDHRVMGCVDGAVIKAADKVDGCG